MNFEHNNQPFVDRVLGYFVEELLRAEKRGEAGRVAVEIYLTAEGSMYKYKVHHDHQAGGSDG